MKTSYITLPNSLLDIKMTANELAVIFYLSSIYAGNNKFVRVRQSVIARKCGLKTAQTVSRITAALEKRGLLEQRRCIYGANEFGTMWYSIKLPQQDKAGFFRVSRHVFGEGLNAAQLRVYLFICRAMSSTLGYCWNSYNDLAQLIGMKRSDVVTIVSQLQQKNVIRKQCVKSRLHKRVYVDNRYTVVRYVKHSPIRKKMSKKIELPDETDSPKALSLLIAQNKHFYVSDNNTFSIKCQEPQHNSYASRGSPLNQRSIILAKYTFFQKKEYY